MSVYFIEAYSLSLTERQQKLKLPVVVTGLLTRALLIVSQPGFHGHRKMAAGIHEKITKFFSINTRMIPAKCVYILSLGATGSYVPYLNIFLISIGLSTSEAGIISGIRFLSAPISTALLGVLIDYTGHRKRIFLVMCLGASLPLCCMPWVAKALSSVPYKNGSHYGDAGSGNLTDMIQYTDFKHPHMKLASPYLFYVILGLMIVAGFFSVPLAGFIDSVVMNVIKTGTVKTSFGGQRMVGSISFGVANFIAGVTADYYGKSKPTLSHYTPIFYLFVGQMLLLIPAGFILLQQANWNNNVCRNATEEDSDEGKVSACHFFCSLFKSSTSIFFLVTVLISGVSYNLFFGYVFLFMRDEMQVSDTLMTLTIVCSTAAEILTFPFTSKLIRFIGDTKLAMIVGIFSYFIRFIVMSFFSSMWIIIPIQLLHGLAFSLSWAAQIEYVQTNTPSGSKVTMFSILTSVHFALGAIIANVLGGELYSLFGGRKLFLGTAVICITWTGVMIMNYNLMKYQGLAATYEIGDVQNGSNNAVIVRTGTDVSHLSPRMVRGAAFTIRYPNAVRNTTDSFKH